MINTTIKDNYVILEYYNKNGYNKVVKDKVKLLCRQNPSNDNSVKIMKNIYNDKYYKLYATNNNGEFYAGVPVPYPLKEYYDYKLCSKLLYYNNIINDDIVLPRTITYDIETTGLDGNVDKITSIAFIDNYDKSEHTLLNVGGRDGELKLLLEFVDYLKDNNILGLVGFNTVGFDNDFLNKRLNKFGIYFNVFMNCNIDVMLLANKLFVTGSLMSMCDKLDISNEDSKLDLGGDNPIKLYNEKRFDELLYYNLQDCKATNAIIDKLNIFSFCESLFCLSYCDFNSLQFNSVLNNHFFNKRMFEDSLFVDRVDLEFKGEFGGGYNYIRK